MQKTLEIVLSPSLYPTRSTQGKCITVVVDVLRYTSSLVAAFGFGVKAVIPASSPEEALAWKQKGYPVAGESDGIKLPFADYGNSANDFDTPAIAGQTLVYTSTNGTVAMNLAAGQGRVAALAFSNLNAVADWVTGQHEQVIILCSGWKNQVSFEDTLCAGALASILLDSKGFSKEGDACSMASDLWLRNKEQLKAAIMQSSHYKRLLLLGVDPFIDKIIQVDTNPVVPVFYNGLILPAGQHA